MSESELNNFDRNHVMHHELKQLGFRVTQQRLKLLKFFEQLDRSQHVSADDIYKAFQEKKDDIGLATIYRILTQFEHAGILRRLNLTQDQAVYEMDHSEHHDHTVCVGCGKIEEFIDPIIESQQLDVVRKMGGRLVDHTAILYIECQTCLRGLSA